MKYALITALVPVDGTRVPGEWFSGMPDNAIYCADILKKLDAATITRVSEVAGMAHMRKIEKDREAN